MNDAARFMPVTEVTLDTALPDEESRVDARYGYAAKAGWSPLPDVLIFHQHKLGLRSEDLNVLLNLMAHYYRRGEMPFIRPHIIAKRMGVSPRSVQRSIARLRRMGLLAKAKHANGHIAHDLQPLIDKLEPLGRARIANREELRKASSSVAQQERAPGF
jgi:DNA-binding MarR family transcriptional regulator